MASESSKKEDVAEFPEFPDLDKEQITGMSHEEKLKLIEKEAQTLYDFCLEKGLSKKEISWCIKPLFGSPPEKMKKVVKDNKNFFLSMAILFGIFGVFAAWSPAYDQLCIHGKLALIKVLPYWDWTYIYDQDCMVPNPYVKPLPNITKEECQVCFELQKEGIESLKNATHDSIANDFLMTDFPAIIEDGIKGWPNPNITIDELNKLYTTGEDLDQVGDCRFNSSLEHLTNVYDFFTSYSDDQIKGKYYASWDNCDLKAAKFFRRYYKRPYYLPPMAEASKRNSFLIAKGKFEDPVSFNYDEDSSGIWITVLQGEAMVDVIPIEGCAVFKGCRAITTNVKKGEAILIPLRLWVFDILPNSDKETIIIASTATWDDPEPAGDEDMTEEEMKSQGK
eukprot:gene4614-5220_t